MVQIALQFSHALEGAIAATFLSKDVSMKALAIGYTSDFIETAQRQPFIYNQKALCELDIEIEFRQVKTLQQMGEACQKYDSDAVFFLPYWNENPNEVESVFKTIRQQDRSRKLIFIDPFAQTIAVLNQL